MPSAGSSLVRFIHSADLHLDSPFAGMRSVAPDRVRDTLYEATFRAYENIIDLCIEEEVDALLVAGDVYDGADRSLRAQLRFIDGLKRLDDAGIRSMVCHGNHDPLDGWVARLEYPSGCHRFGSRFESVPLFVDDPNRVVVHGISYPTRDVFDNLLPGLGAVDSSAYNIGLLHSNVGNNPDHAAYAPCSLDDLARSGVDYWALGHIHTRQVLRERGPAAVYPGNPLVRHPNESGARGVFLVEVNRDGDVRLDFRAVDVVRWERLRMDVSSIVDEQGLIDGLNDEIEEVLVAAEGRSVVVRVSLEGRTALHGELRQEDVNDLMTQINKDWGSRAPFVWCERIDDLTTSEFNRESRLEGSDFVADLLRLRDAARSDAALFGRISSEVDSVYRHPRYGKYLRDFAPSDDEFDVMVDEAEKMAVDLLIGGDDQ